MRPFIILLCVASVTLSVCGKSDKDAESKAGVALSINNPSKGKAGKPKLKKDISNKAVSSWAHWK